MEAEDGEEGAAGGGGGGDPSCGWSWEENKMFEVALAVVEEGNSERWERVAAMIGGGKEKSAEEVKRHYEVLLEDLHSIESGRLDHELFAAPVAALDDDDDAVAAAAAACCWTCCLLLDGRGPRIARTTRHTVSVKVGCGDKSPECQQNSCFQHHTMYYYFG